ncbi:hypothetical protein GWK36_06070 [Caldichromatium japonicum]|uniref:Uncharacterized protein n=1 Tax=Caldichromatium japonicum TaxID=2699430 RepID=A0A6G7VCI7_9GAMM|nr:hypothetical protein [Caldichromatium japonicum]QIK37620.1 hypothetical protein GWK36_06070 [Caldichromatium japonicum]
MDALSERVEGISHSVGYSLENAAYNGLSLILSTQGIALHGRLLRRYLGDYQLIDKKHMLFIVGMERRDMRLLSFAAREGAQGQGG